jgi:hypothetical protein
MVSHTGMAIMSVTIVERMGCNMGFLGVTNRSKVRTKEVSQQLNGNAERIYSNLKNLYISTFKWLNMPETINTRFIELKLFEGARLAFFKDKHLGFLCLRATLASRLNVYYEPINVRAFGGGGYQKRLKNYNPALIGNDNQCVLLYNTKIRNEDMPFARLEDYALQIAMQEKTVHVNTWHQRIMWFLRTSKKQEHTVKNMFQQYDGFTPMLFVDDKFGDLTVETFGTETKFVADKLQMLKKQIINEALSYIGIENNSSEKNERLTGDEVLISNGMANANKNSRLEERKDACGHINKLFNLDIDVKYINPLEYDSAYQLIDNASNGGDE